MTARCRCDADQDHGSWREVRPEDPAERLERVDAFAGARRAVLPLPAASTGCASWRTTTSPAPGSVVAQPLRRRRLDLARNTSVRRHDGARSCDESYLRAAGLVGRRPGHRRASTDVHRAGGAGPRPRALRHRAAHASRRPTGRRCRPTSYGTATPRWTARRPACSTPTAPTRPSTSPSGTPAAAQRCSTAASSACTPTSAAAARAAGAGGSTAAAAQAAHVRRPRRGRRRARPRRAGRRRTGSRRAG